MFTNISIQNVSLFFFQSVFMLKENAECILLQTKDEWDWEDEDIGQMSVIKKKKKEHRISQLIHRISFADFSYEDGKRYHLLVMVFVFAAPETPHATYLPTQSGSSNEQLKSCLVRQ